MSADDFKPRTVRERLAMEIGRADGLREAIRLYAQGNVTLATAEPVVDRGAAGLPPEVVALEDLLREAGFSGRQDRDNPGTWVWERGSEEVAVDHDDPDTAEGEKVRWFTADGDDPHYLSVLAAIEVASGRKAITRAGEEAKR